MGIIKARQAEEEVVPHWEINRVLSVDHQKMKWALIIHQIDNQDFLFVI